MHKKLQSENLKAGDYLVDPGGYYENRYQRNSILSPECGLD
jgi:hypothetical protein